MPFTRTIKNFILICLLWAVAFGLSSCVSTKLTKEDVHRLQMSAQRGDAKSRVLIGEMYEFGADVPENQMIAAQWYQLAAKQDNPEAQFYLGVMYEQGVVLYRNTAESLKWLFKAGEQGQEKAHILLAGIYLKDKGLGREFSKIIRRYRRSAEKGNAVAQYTLGWIYREGVGLPAYPQEALKWYHKAARQGNVEAQFALGNIYLEGKVAPANLSEALAWYRKSAETEIKAQAKLRELYKGVAGLPENAQEAKKWSKTLAQNTDASLRSYIDRQHTIINSEKEKHPAMALRACQRISEVDQAFRDVSNTCDVLRKQISEKMNPRIQEAGSALAQKDWNKFRILLSPLLTPDFDEGQLRRLIASAWRLIEEETRAKEKIAQEQLRAIEAAERSAAYRKKNMHQILKLINTFKATMAQGLRDNPEDAALLSLARKGNKVIASLQQKMKPSRPIEEKAVADLPEETEEDIEPGEDEYQRAQALFNNGRFAEAANLFDKTTKIRGSKYIAPAYIYLGISHLARINPANINEARKRHLKGLSCFQNALRFDSGIALPAGYDKYQPVFDKAKEQLH